MAEFQTWVVAHFLTALQDWGPRKTACGHYQRDGSLLQTRRGSGGVHVVKQAVYLPQWNSSSSVTDLDTHCGIAGATRCGWRGKRRAAWRLRLTFMDRSSLPRVTLAFTGGKPSLLVSWSSTVALIEFCQHQHANEWKVQRSSQVTSLMLTLKSSNSMWNRWDGTYTTWMGFPAAFASRRQCLKAEWQKAAHI